MADMLDSKATYLQALGACYPWLISAQALTERNPEEQPAEALQLAAKSRAFI